MACLKCGSQNIGFDDGSSKKVAGALIGGALNQATGGSALVGAAIGAMAVGKSSCVCLDCGEKWSPERQKQCIEVAQQISGYEFDWTNDDNRKAVATFITSFDAEKDQENAKKISELRTEIKTNEEKPHSSNRLTFWLHTLIASPFAYACYAIWSDDAASDGLKVAGIVCALIAIYFFNSGVRSSSSSEDKIKDDLKELQNILKRYKFLKPRELN